MIQAKSGVRLRQQADQNSGFQMRPKVQRRGVILKKCAVAPLTEFQRKYVEQLAAHHKIHFSPDQCYRNGQRLIIRDSEKRLRYWEGLRGGVPYSWLTIDGKVIDVTAEAVRREAERRGVAESGEHSDYRGIVVSRREVLRHILETSEYGPVVDTPLLRSGSPPHRR